MLPILLSLLQFEEKLKLNDSKLNFNLENPFK